MLNFMPKLILEVRKMHNQHYISLYWLKTNYMVSLHGEFTLEYPKNMAWIVIYDYTRTSFELNLNQFQECDNHPMYTHFSLGEVLDNKVLVGNWKWVYNILNLLWQVQFCGAGIIWEKHIKITHYIFKSILQKGS